MSDFAWNLQCPVCGLWLMVQRPKRLPAGLFFFDPGLVPMDDGSLLVLTPEEIEAREDLNALLHPPNPRRPFINTLGYEKLRILKP